MGFIVWTDFLKQDPVRLSVSAWEKIQLMFKDDYGGHYKIYAPDGITLLDHNSATERAAHEDMIVVPNGYHAASVARLIASDRARFAAHEAILRTRNERFVGLRAMIHTTMGGLDRFAHSHQHYGFYARGAYRVWMPGVHAVFFMGDFNDWRTREYPLVRESANVWHSTQLPHTIPQWCRYALHVQPRADSTEAQCFMRQDPWSKYDDRPPRAQQLDARIYRSEDDPDAFRWAHSSPLMLQGLADKRALKIYECHVGIAGEANRVHTYREFADTRLSYIADTGYTAIQLMAVPEHPLYKSFGYQSTHLFAPSSRFGAPNDLKYLVDEAHRLGLRVILDIVHTHSCSNVADGLGLFNGPDADNCFFANARAGSKNQWGTLDFDYGKPEVLRYLLSSLTWWIEEFRVDGFRFDAVMHGIFKASGSAEEARDNGCAALTKLFWSDKVSTRLNQDALAYFALANYYVHARYPHVITIAEDVSGFPTLLSPDGIGFDYRLNMGADGFLAETFVTRPNYLSFDFYARGQSRADHDISWERLLKLVCDEDGRNKSIAYLQCHDGCFVGARSLACAIFGCETMRWHMADGSARHKDAERGLAVYNNLRTLVFGTAWHATLTFQGNEFGHPDWIELPTETPTSDGDFTYARRLYSLVQDPTLVYKHMYAWERALLRAENEHGWLGTVVHVVPMQQQQQQHGTNKHIFHIIRGDPESPTHCHFIVNMSAHPNDTEYTFGCFQAVGSSVRIILNSDAPCFGGHDRPFHNSMHSTSTNEKGFKSAFLMRIPPRTSLFIIVSTISPELSLPDADSMSNAEPIVALCNDTPTNHQHQNHQKQGRRFLRLVLSGTLGRNLLRFKNNVMTKLKR